jgi:hypothetical protein
MAFFNHPLAPIVIWYDNLSVIKAVNHLSSRDRPEFPNDTIWPSWDILQAICKNFNCYPDLSVFHVKDQQKNTFTAGELPLPAQLNIQADSLATTFQQISTYVDDQTMALLFLGLVVI